MTAANRNLYDMTPDERKVEHIRRMREVIAETNSGTFNRKMRTKEERDAKDYPDGPTFVTD